MSWFGILLIGALQGGIACAISQAKNRPGREGFLLGFLLGPIGIIIVLCLPKMAASRGWYQDPSDPGQQRYWDGVRWSDLPPRPSTPAPPLRPMPPPAEPRENGP